MHWSKAFLKKQVVHSRPTYLKKKKMFVLVIFCISCINLIIADDISVSQFKFVGYKNVYYEGSDHQVSITLYLPGQIQPCRLTQNPHWKLGQ